MADLVRPDPRVPVSKIWHALDARRLIYKFAFRTVRTAECSTDRMGIHTAGNPAITSRTTSWYVLAPTVNVNCRVELEPHVCSPENPFCSTLLLHSCRITTRM